MNIKPIHLLDHSEIRALAHNQAENCEACSHGFEVGSCKAILYERAYIERLRELEEVEV